MQIPVRVPSLGCIRTKKGNLFTIDDGEEEWMMMGEN